MADLGGPVNTLRAAVITTLAMLVAGALSVGTLVFVVMTKQSGESISSSDWMGVVCFGLLPLVVIAIGLNASLRVRRDGAGADESFTFLARLSPLLLLVGAIAGGYAMVTLQRDHMRSLHQSASSLCERIAESGPRCEPLAFECERQGRVRRAKDDGTHGAHFVPDFEQRPEVLCLKAALK